jgi:hypothetical protein
MPSNSYRLPSSKAAVRGINAIFVELTRKS